jgi:hypothetical protein
MRLFAGFCMMCFAITLWPLLTPYIENAEWRAWPELFRSLAQVGYVLFCVYLIGTITAESRK